MTRQRVDPAACAHSATPDDPRLAQHVRALPTFDVCGAHDVVLIGVPDDRGVAINRGRVGAAAGPKAFREAFYRLTLGPNRELAKCTIWDAGDVMIGATNRETHETLAEIVQQCCACGALPIVIGGGHDNTYGGIKGAVAHARAGIVNIDAHLDLRPNEPDGGIGSGTPLRRVLDDELIAGEQLIEWGFQPHTCSAAHLEFAKQRGVRLWSWPERGPDVVRLFAQFLQDLRHRWGRTAISLDLDAIVASAAPGVSAPSTFGFTPQEVLAFLQLAGAESSLCYLDVMELNPSCDVDGRTTRLAATLVWHLLCERTRS